VERSKACRLADDLLARPDPARAPLSLRAVGPSRWQGADQRSGAKSVGDAQDLTPTDRYLRHWQAA
jgi:hypothetical protein